MIPVTFRQYSESAGAMVTREAFLRKSSSPGSFLLIREGKVIDKVLDTEAARRFPSAFPTGAPRASDG